MKKNAGFTMIELLAAIVILGILMGIAIPTVLNVLSDSRNRTYIDDALRMASTMDMQLRKDNMMPLPALGSCVVMNLTYLDNNTFKDAPYGGEYDRVYSFVVARRENLSDYQFFPRLVEKLPKGKSGYRGIDFTEIDFLYANNAKDLHIKSIAKSNLFDASTKTVEQLQAELKPYGIYCETVIVYAPNAEDDDPDN